MNDSRPRGKKSLCLSCKHVGLIAAYDGWIECLNAGRDVHYDDIDTDTHLPQWCPGYEFEDKESYKQTPPGYRGGAFTIIRNPSPDAIVKSDRRAIESMERAIRLLSTPGALVVKPYASGFDSTGSWWDETGFVSGFVETYLKNNINDLTEYLIEKCRARIAEFEKEIQELS